MDTVIAIPVALLAAATFAVSAVLQQRTARLAPADESLSWRLIYDLIRKPMWLAGMVCALAGFGLQATALAFGPIAVVEPVICLELVLALPLAAHLAHRRLGPREWVGAGMVAAGVGSFLALADAKGGDAAPALVRWAIVGGPTIFAIVIAVLLARGPESPRRAGTLAVAAGLSFGLMALITQSFVQEFSNHGFAVLGMWQPYALAILGPIGFTIGQSAYQSGPLATSLPIVDSIEPTMSVVLAVVAFHQQVSLEPTHLGIECAAGLVAVSGIFLLGRSPLVLGVYEQQQRDKDGPARAGLRDSRPVHGNAPGPVEQAAPTG